MMGGMRHRRYDRFPERERVELIAGFGGAEIIKFLDGRLEIRGGTAAEQAEARAWQQRFLSSSGLTPRPTK